MMPTYAGWLGAGIVAVLTIATIIDAILKWRVARGQPHADIDNVNARIASWWAIAAITGLAAWAGALAVFALFATVSVLSLREYIAAPVPLHTPRRWIAEIGRAHV